MSLMKKDYLNREDFVDKIFRFIQEVSSLEKGCCFAIDGKWGSGKSFVLDMIEKMLRTYQSEETSDNKYFVFHYNCWQYDYYEEPSIAIVSAMLNAIADENSFLGGNADDKLKASYELVKEELKKMAGKFAENHLGINFIKVWDSITNKEQEICEEKNKYDTLFGFKQALDDARNSLQMISREKTVIIVVDELDRCIPSYAIKVLERVHHLFDGIKNVVVIIAVDSQQLECSVKEIYGQAVIAKDYLKKNYRYDI